MDNETKEKKFPSYRGVPDAVWRGVLKFFVIARSEATFPPPSLRGAKRRSNLKRDCGGVPKEPLAMTKKTEGCQPPFCHCEEWSILNNYP
ncbi:MAG: hypothetical protein ACP5KZ_07540, partial [bacterium]